MDLVALSNGLHGSVQMDSVALFSWIGWLRHHGIFTIALTESAVSTFQDELHWSRKKSTIILGIIMIGLGTLSCLGYGPLSNVTIIGMQFLDFFDFLTNSVMMPIAAIAICIFVSRVVGLEKVEAEITKDGNSFKRKKIFNFMIQYLCPIFAFIILLSSIANAFGFISM